MGIGRRRDRNRVKDEPPPGLGDVVEKALSSVGITPERVEKWLGRPCRCRERKRKLNQLSNWVRGVLGMKKSLDDKDPDTHKEEFDRMVGDDDGGTSSPST